MLLPTTHIHNFLGKCPVMRRRISRSELGGHPIVVPCDQNEVILLASFLGLGDIGTLFTSTKRRLFDVAGSLAFPISTHLIYLIHVG